MTRYEPAASRPDATRCQPGTRALGSAIRQVWPELHTLTPVYGCFNPRKVHGSTMWSLHAEGRALDVGVDQADDDLGWGLACDLVGNHVVLGVQRVIWSGHIWSIEHLGEWRRLRPTSQQHWDHIHLEQRWTAARKPASVQAVYERVLREARSEPAVG